MVAAMVVHFIALLFIHDFVLVSHFTVSLDLSWLHKTPLLQDFLTNVFVTEKLYSEFVLELKEFFRFLRDGGLRKVQDAVIKCEGLRQMVLA